MLRFERPTIRRNEFVSVAISFFSFFIVVQTNQTLHDVCNRNITQKETNKEKQHHESNVTVNYTNTLSTGNGNAKTKSCDPTVTAFFVLLKRLLQLKTAGTSSRA